MKTLRSILDRVGRNFEKGGRLERFHPFWEAADTFFYTPASVTKSSAHVRDALDLKRMMMTVVIAAPCVFMALYNTGCRRICAGPLRSSPALDGWRHDVIRWLRVVTRRAA
jgi:Na+-transporting NADH:ubiquinone oxidoreductase subunit B